MTVLCAPQVPVEIYNTKLVQVFMNDVAEAGLVNADPAVLDLASSTFMERTLQALKDEVSWRAPAVCICAQRSRLLACFGMIRWTVRVRVSMRGKRMRSASLFVADDKLISQLA